MTHDFRQQTQFKKKGAVTLTRKVISPSYWLYFCFCLCLSFWFSEDEHVMMQKEKKPDGSVSFDSSVEKSRKSNSGSKKTTNEKVKETVPGLIL